MDYSRWLYYNEDSEQCSMCGTPIEDNESYCSGTCFEADKR
jgi:predicted nucleic acid-binding Zn ribbon protein